MPLLILAGNYQQAVDFVRRHARACEGKYVARIVQERDALRGWDPPKTRAVLCGEYWKNDAFKSPYFHEMRARGLELVTAAALSRSR